MNNIEEAVTRFKEGFNCSQAVCSAYAEQFGANQDTVLKISTGFGGGIGRLAGTCGAVTGAVMVLGLKYGMGTIEDKEAKEITYAKVQDFARKFMARNGSLLCKELLDCDISISEGLERAREQKLFTERCPQFVRAAAEILEEML